MLWSHHCLQNPSLPPQPHGFLPSLSLHSGYHWPHCCSSFKKLISSTSRLPALAVNAIWGVLLPPSPPPSSSGSVLHFISNSAHPPPAPRTGLSSLPQRRRSNALPPRVTVHPLTCKCTYLVTTHLLRLNTSFLRAASSTPTCGA